MDSNTVPRNLNRLISLAEDAADGAHDYCVAVNTRFARKKMGFGLFRKSDQGLSVITPIWDDNRFLNQKRCAAVKCHLSNPK